MSRITAANAVVVIAALMLLIAPGSAPAEATAPQWTLTSVSRPTNLKPSDGPGAEDAYRLTLTNTGGAPSDGSPVVVTDELPAGLSLDPTGAYGEDQLLKANHPSVNPGVAFSCVLRTCTYTGVVVPDQTLVLTFPVDVSAGPFASTCEVPAVATGCLLNTVRVSGGGALSASAATPTVISTQPAGFGVAPGGSSTALSSVQAGAHPDITNLVAFNTVTARGAEPGDLKDLTFDLPPGFAGDLVDTPSCSTATFAEGKCPIATQIGVATTVIVGLVNETVISPVYNLAPNPGELAKLAFVVKIVHIIGGVSVRPGDYGLRTTFTNLNSAGTEVDSSALTVWGVPADPIHDPLRFRNREPGPEKLETVFGHPSDAARAPFFTNPTSCGVGPLHSGFRIDSWEQPEVSVAEQMVFGPVVGCDRLGIEPSLTAEPTTNRAYAPTGLDVVTRIPQTYENPDGLATSAMKREVVTLPEGMTVNPSSGAGLAACSEAQYAEEGVQFVPGRGCPNESRLASVKIVTPSLKEEVKGSLFLAEPAPFGEPGKNPFGSLLAVYIVARIPNRGVLIKSPGLVQANELTGQLTTSFDDLPPLPFSVATFSFNQGANAPLVTPATCGLFTVTAALTPYSNPEGAPVTPLVPPFPISAGCPAGGAPPFAPQVIAGTQNNAAGSYSALYLRISRNDGEQEITGFSTVLPPGLTGNLSGIPFCTEAQIAAARAQTGAQAETSAACPAASQIGRSIAEAGVGGVLAQTPGRLYLGGPFEDAPFSVVSVTSAKVGPFDLGTVIVHLPLHIDPITAQVSIPSGPADQIPHIIKGIVVHLRTIRAYVDRERFMINPTSCNPMGLSGTVIGSGTVLSSAVAQVPITVTDPFQAADCQALKFKPSFTVSTTGRTSKANGASLSVRLTMPGPLGTEANIHQVKVELPVQLPSRLTTLQKACTAAQFHTNPAGCPAASVVGHARAITPILPVPLEGPAYFVSNGGEAFPNLIMVLQGYGVTIDLVGDTFISKAGITSSTFKAVPDQPVSSFELTLPQGPYSALTANGDLCALTRTVLVKKKIKVRTRGHKRTITRRVRQTLPASLSMPTEFVAQNGMAIHQNTPVGVTDCPKARPAKKKGKKR
jgi:uncharacterized repeat protein (TIGR01451 family)